MRVFFFILIFLIYIPSDSYSQATISVINSGASSKILISDNFHEFQIGELNIPKSEFSNFYTSNGFYQSISKYYLNSEVTKKKLCFQYKFFPNPVITFLNINILKLADCSEKIELVLLNTSGAILQRRVIAEGDNKIMLNTLPSANYYIVLLQNNEVVERKKIMKN